MKHELMSLTMKLINESGYDSVALETLIVTDLQFMYLSRNPCLNLLEESDCIILYSNQFIVI